MKIRNMIICAAAALLCGNTVCASNSIELSAKANSEAGVIKITGSAPAQWGRRKVAIVVCRPSDEEQFTDFTDMSEEEFLKSVYTIKEVICENSGAFTAEIILGEDAPSGYYVIKAGATGLESEPNNDVRVLYADKDAVCEALRLVNSAADAADMKKVIDEYNEILSLDIDNGIYTKYADSAVKVLYMLKGNGFEEASVLQAAYDVSLKIADIVNAQGEASQQKLTQYSSILGVDAGNSDFSDNIAAVAELVKLNISSIGEYRDNIGGYFDCMTAIAAVNSSDRSTAAVLLEKYAAILELNLGADYQTVNKYELGKAFVGAGFTNKSEIQLALNKRINELKEQSSPSKPSGGGGGGSAGGSRTVTVLPSQVQPDIGNGQTTAEKFIDVDKTHWAAEAIYALCDMAVLSGMGNGEFKPDAPVTREQIARMLVAAFDLPQGGNVEFLDVEENSWYAGYVAAAYESGVIAGIGNDEFGVGQNVLRQDLMAMLYRVMKNCGYKFPQAETEVFKDAELISDYAADAIYSLNGVGIANGSDNRIEPLQSCTRAEAARLIWAVINTVNGERESDEI